MVGKIFDDKCSSCLQPLQVGKPFRRRVLELVATLAGMETFSMPSPQSGCNISWSENFFDDESSGCEKDESSMLLQA